MPEPNSITCDQCGQSTSVAEVLPKFCSNCGARFESTIGQTGAAGSTDHPLPDQTIAATSSVDLDLENTHDSSFVIRPSSSAGKLEPGSQIGPFKLGCQLGAGGMGTVYEAYDTDSDCHVALKILSKQVRTSQEGVERFRRESQVAASINHPGSTFVYRSGQYGDQFFIAMELMNGGTLKDIVEEEGPMEVSRAVDFMIHAIDGLAVAHEVGIVHRDFKPSNCFVDDDGQAKVGDFGLAKNFFGDVALTQTGAFVGTPQFAAPEQLRAGHVDGRTDIYAVAGTLFYLLTGRAPFVGDAAQVISGIAAEQAPNIKTIAPHIPEKLAALIASMLEKDPARRPGSLEQIRIALLPFSSLGAVAPDNGQRMAAFFIDLFILGCVSIIAMLCMAPLAVLIGPAKWNFLVTGANVLIAVFWFAIQEYKSGTTIGKWLFKMRVVNGNNDSPRLWQALVRPVLIPGTYFLLSIVPVFIFGTAEPKQSINVEDLMKIGLVELVQLLAWIPCCLMMLSARITNGYRGLHDLATNTRVVRISSSLVSERCSDQPITAPTPVEADSFPAEAIEPFRVLGQLSSNPHTNERVLVGDDPELDRKVWIYETSDPDPPLSRAGIRPTRQRIIASRKDDSGDHKRHYFIAECIEGLPFQQFIESNEAIQWSTFRPLLRDLASELEKADDEGSLPNNFNTDNVWLDRRGQLKLVEIDSGKETSSLTSKEVFDFLFDQVVKAHPVPEHVIELSRQWHKSTDVSMGEIVDTLDDLAERPSSWSWIDRIGAASVLVAIELAILFLLCQVWVALWTSLFTKETLVSSPGYVAAICGSFTLLMLGGAFLTGYFFESPTFWFLGIAARNRDKQATPSRVRLGFRMVVSWLLPTVMAAALGGVQAAAVTKGMEVPSVELVVAFLLLPATSFAMLVVTLYNLAKPSRGTADLLCGTMLTRK